MDDKVSFDCNLPFYESLDKFRKEYIDDTNVSLSNLGDKVMMVPGIKAKWIARKNSLENSLLDLKRSYKKILADEIKNVSSSSPVELTKNAAEKIAKENSETLKIIDERMELLERLVKQCSSYIQDHLRYFNNEIQTIIDYKKLEQM